MYDYLIKGALIVDGTGSPGVRGNIGIGQGKIVALGDIEGKAKKTIEAGQLVAAPGFIDITNHSDTYWTLFSVPGQESMLAQGVTTIFGGNCGSSLAPLASPEAIRSIQKWTPLAEVSVNWARMKEFLNVLEERPLGVNFGTFVGHSTLRRGAIGDEVKKLTPDELQEMTHLLEEALTEGAFGLSTGLVYAHGKFTPLEELVRLGKVLAKRKRLYITHLRSEGQHLLSAVDEVIHISEESGAKAHISHFKAIGSRNWPAFPKALVLLKRAHERGIEVTFDVYPYLSTGSLLHLLLPDWVLKGGKERILMRIGDPQMRPRIIKQMQEHPISYHHIIIADAWRAGVESAVGKSIKELSSTLGKYPEEVVLDLLLGHDLRVVTLQLKELHLKNLKRALECPRSVISSDGAGYDESYSQKNVLVHPRSYGTFARVLGQLVRKKKVLALEEAVAKMTGRAADVIGLSHRGKIERGFFADLVLFDLERIMDNASYLSPFRFPSGIEYVFVNGVLALKEGEITGERAGHVLRAK